MSTAFTAKNYTIRKAPKLISLLGDKTKRPEPAQHIIEFPGGAVEVSRTTDGNYWAHIIVYRGEPEDDNEGTRAATGEIVGSRIGRTYEANLAVAPIQDETTVEQIAVLIRPKRS